MAAQAVVSLQALALGIMSTMTLRALLDARQNAAFAVDGVADPVIKEAETLEAETLEQMLEDETQTLGRF